MSGSDSGSENGVHSEYEEIRQAGREEANQVISEIKKDWSLFFS